MASSLNTASQLAIKYSIAATGKAPATEAELMVLTSAATPNMSAQQQSEAVAKAVLNSNAAKAALKPGIFTAEAQAKTILANHGVTDANAVAFLQGMIEGTIFSSKVGLPLDVVISTLVGFLDSYKDGSNAAFDAVIKQARTALNGAFTAAEQNIVAPVGSFELKTSQDVLTGGAGADTFTARIIDNTNSFQTGDILRGSSGKDQLVADIGNSQNFAITLESDSIEILSIRAQATANDSTDNNMSEIDRVQVDAERMYGLEEVQSVNSRADLLIEDLRLSDARNADGTFVEYTEDIRISMIATDPGHVDYGVYFDQPSLRALPSTQKQTELRWLLVDTNDLTNGKAFNNVPFNSLTVLVNGKDYKITFSPTELSKVASVNTGTVVQQYEALVALTNTALKAAGEYDIVASLGAAESVVDSLTGQRGTAYYINLKSSAKTLAEKSMGAWGTPTGDQPSDGALLYTVQKGPESSSGQAKITSTITLDFVGRGSVGGDLVVGSLATGSTLGSIASGTLTSERPYGVERFDITVERDSRLQTINSTSDALEEVILRSGQTIRDVSTNQLRSGSLSIVGDIPTGQNVTGENRPPSEMVDQALPGVITPNAGNQNTVGYGLNDVRKLDASNFNGQLVITAQIGDRAVSKYMNLVDQNADPKNDNVLQGGNDGLLSVWDSIVNHIGLPVFDGPSDVSYKLGTQADNLILKLSQELVGSRSSINIGREDFRVLVDGDKGNDHIVVRLVDDSLKGGLESWYKNQDLNNNVTILGGDGSDTIRKLGAGDTYILTGTVASDTVYSDNTGKQLINIAGAVKGTSLKSTSIVLDEYSDLNDTIKADIEFSPGPGNALVDGIWVVNSADQTTAGVVGSRNMNNIRSDANDGYNFFKVGVQVSVLGIKAVSATEIFGLSDGAATKYRSFDLDVNQAVKKNVNNDPVLSKLVVAEDGPANTLVFRSKIDGTMIDANLKLDFGFLLTSTTGTIVGISKEPGEVLPDVVSSGALTLDPVTVAEAAAEYKLPASTTADELIKYMTAQLKSFTDKGDYNAKLVNDGTSVVAGRDSAASTDNFISSNTSPSDTDVIVLSTTEGATSASSSNELVEYSGTGKLVIVNFDSTGNGIDFLRNAGFTGTLIVVDKDGNDITSAVTTSTPVKYTPVASVLASGVAGTIASLVPLGPGSETSVPAGSGGGVVTPPAGGGGGVVTPPITGSTTQAITAAGTFDAAASNVTYNITAGNYAATISNFAAGDKLVGPSGVTVSVANDSYTDNTVQLTWSSAGQTVTISLVGLTAAQDSAIFSANSFNSVFGPGSV